MSEDGCANAAVGLVIVGGLLYVLVVHVLPILLPVAVIGGFGFIFGWYITGLVLHFLDRRLQRNHYFPLLDEHGPLAIALSGVAWSVVGYILLPRPWLWNIINLFQWRINADNLSLWVAAILGLIWGLIVVTRHELTQEAPSPDPTGMVIISKRQISQAEWDASGIFHEHDGTILGEIHEDHQRF